MLEAAEPKLANPSIVPAVPQAIDKCAEAIVALKSSVSDLRGALGTVLTESPTTCSADKPEDRNVCSLANAIDDLTLEVRDATSYLNVMRSELQV
ncbi:hypothetical protein LCGC14_1731970 [marine sediment metagenome]|uniref:Uncharacterized protein n=1 Tax=marine sediment metagenome TaxID=412755 RepID=A0A0F9K8Z0_9ZZZZ